MRLPRRRVLLAALPLVLVTGVALAAQPGGRRASSAVIHACVKKKTGLVRIVAASATCRRGESSVDVERPGRARRGRRARSGRPAGPGRSRGSGRRQGRRGAQGAGRPAGPAGPQGPAGPAGPSLPSLESLNGVGCHLAGAPGTATLTYDAGGVATLKCVPTGGGSSAQIRVNELMTGSTGAASNEFVELVQRRLERGGRRRLQGRLPLLGGHERHHARDDPGRHEHPRRRLLPARRQRLPRLARGRPELLGLARVDRRRRSPSATRRAGSSTRSATATRRTRSWRPIRPRRRRRPRLREAAPGGSPTATTRTTTRPTSRSARRPLRAPRTTRNDRRAARLRAARQSLQRGMLGSKRPPDTGSRGAHPSHGVFRELRKLRRLVSFTSTPSNGCSRPSSCSWTPSWPNEHARSCGSRTRPTEREHTCRH